MALSSNRATHEPSPDGLGHPVSVPSAWRCFHCDEVFETRASAAEHFGEGYYEGEMPLCIEAATTEQKALVLTNREMYEELRKLRDREEALEFQLSNFEYIARKLTGKPGGNTNDIQNEWEAMEGRVLAAEAAINAAPKWLAAWLRRKSERDWRVAQAIEARSGETVGLDPKDESAVRQDAPNTPVENTNAGA